MKTVIILVFLFVGQLHAQQIVDLDVLDKTPKTEQQLIGKSVKTADQARFKGKLFPIYTSVNGKQFIVYQNSRGNWTKKYLK